MQDIIIIGGSYAGLSAAMALGRSLRNTLVIDSGLPCNIQTPYSHNFLTQDGKKPAEIANAAKEQVLQYGTVSILNDRVIEVSGSNGEFNVTTLENRSFSTQKLLFATGIKDILPEIPGFSSCWGISAIHCPYCHGYEVRNEKTGILVNDASVYEFVQLIHHWAAMPTVFTNGEVQFDRDLLDRQGIEIVTDELASIQHEDGHLSSLVLASGSEYSLNVLYHRPAFEQHCPIPETLGCRLTETGHIEVTNFQETTLPGIYAAGDCTTLFRSVSGAVAQGNIAGAMLNKELIKEAALIEVI
ncbi:MAG: NAD(P)/FAD-dependent oxidoreductase [Bacteroidota bacterium]